MTNMDYYYVLGADGKTPIVADNVAWAVWFKDADDKRIVGRTNISKSVFVSTVFLSLNHAFGGGPPQLFETMVFGGKHDGHTDRYSTWEAAELGHAKAVELVHKTIGQLFMKIVWL